MENLDAFLEDIRRLEKSFFQLILSSFVFTLLLVLAQPMNNDLQFKALTELTGGMMGTAGVLSVHLSNLHHPKESASYLLDYEPVLLGLRATVALTVSWAMFYCYYEYATKQDKLSLLFLALGMFLFFRTIAHAAHTIRRNQQQQAVWWGLSEQERLNWLQMRRELERTARDMDKLAEDIDEKLAAINSNLKKDEISRKQDARHARAMRLATAWRKVRMKIGGKALLTSDEKIGLELESLRKQAEYKKFSDDYAQEQIQLIHSGSVPKQALEGINGVEVYKIGAAQYYLFLPPTSDLTNVGPLFDIPESIKRATQNTRLAVSAIVPQGGKISIEAECQLRNHGIAVVREMSVKGD